MAQRTKGADEKFCSECGEIIRVKAEICPKCGVRQAVEKGPRGRLRMQKTPWYKFKSEMPVELKCHNCGTTSEVKLQRQGSLGTELAVWIFTCGLLGWIYSIWRYMEKVAVCPECGKSTKW